MEQIQNK